MPVGPSRPAVSGVMRFRNPDPGCAVNVVGKEARPTAMKHALSNSFGFGGTNVSLLLSRI